MKESTVYPLAAFVVVLSCTLLIHFIVNKDTEENIKEQEEVISKEPVDVIKTARIHPESAYSSSQLEVKYDIDRDVTSPRFNYTWRRNGLIIPGVSKNILGPEHFNKGDEVCVEIEMADSGLLTESFRPPAIRILNTPPRIMEASLTMEARSAPGIFINMKSQDADGDRISYDYIWYRNGDKLEGHVGARLDPSFGMRGDFIHTEIVASDGQSRSASYRTGAIELQNHAPRITSFPPSSTLEDRFVYQVQCEDKDGDEISLELLYAPPGMTIGRDGRIEWIVPRGEGRENAYTMRIKASDIFGGESIQDITFSIAVMAAGQ